MKILSGSILTSLLVLGCSKGNPELDAKVKALSERVDVLEASQGRFEKVESFVRPVMEQQAAEQQRKAASEPDPNARFAVSIDGDESHGPANAAVTIIEAFDFA